MPGGRLQDPVDPGELKVEAGHQTPVPCSGPDVRPASSQEFAMRGSAQGKSQHAIPKGDAIRTGGRPDPGGEKHTKARACRYPSPRLGERSGSASALIV